jgi:hypothetical protein
MLSERSGAGRRTALPDLAALSEENIMSYSDLKAIGMSGGPGTNKIDPLLLFIVGLDGEGDTEQARVDWLKARFPKLASKVDALRDPRACVEITEDAIRAFRPKHAGSVKYENMGVKFGDDAGRWSGKQFIAVNGGRQRTKTMRALNAKRLAEGSPALEIQIEGKRFESDMDRREGKAIENASIVQQTPMQRAWLAYELTEGGMKSSDAAPLVNVCTEQAVKNLLALLKCSDAVQAAVDLGPDGGGITQTAALQIAKLGDHDKQDAELAARLGAAEGKSGRERSKAIRGEGEQKPKPVALKVLGRVKQALLDADASDPHGWAAIVAWQSGDADAYDALPNEFRAAVTSANKSAEKPAKEKPVTLTKAEKKAAAELAANDAQKAAA